MLKITGILETAIFVDDQARSFDFYQRVLGLTPFGQGGFLVAPGQILLLVQRGTTLQPKRLPGGTIPACGATGSEHVAFSVPANDFEAWRERLVQAGVAELSEVKWDLGGHSLFFRDPDGHLLELATPGVWEVY